MLRRIGSQREILGAGRSITQRGRPHRLGLERRGAHAEAFAAIASAWALFPEQHLARPERVGPRAGCPAVRGAFPELRRPLTPERTPSAALAVCGGGSLHRTRTQWRFGLVQRKRHSAQTRVPCVRPRRSRELRTSRARLLGSAQRAGRQGAVRASVESRLAQCGRRKGCWWLRSWRRLLGAVAARCLLPSPSFASSFRRVEATWGLRFRGCSKRDRRRCSPGAGRGSGRVRDRCPRLMSSRRERAFRRRGADVVDRMRVGRDQAAPANATLTG